MEFSYHYRHIRNTSHHLDTPHYLRCIADNIVLETQQCYEMRPNRCTAFHLLSAVLVPSPTMAPENNRSSLFCLWLLGCCVMVNIFIGFSSSFIISRKEEEAMETLSEAAYNNYSLGFWNYNYHWILSITLKFLELARVSGAASTNQDGKAVQKLISNLLDDQTPTIFDKVHTSRCDNRLW